LSSTLFIIANFIPKRFQRLRFDLQADFLIPDSGLKSQEKYLRFNTLRWRINGGSKHICQMGDKEMGWEANLWKGATEVAIALTIFK
jgi:hypothetical protein